MSVTQYIMNEETYNEIMVNLKEYAEEIDDLDERMDTLDALDYVDRGETLSKKWSRLIKSQPFIDGYGEWVKVEFNSVYVES